MILAAGVQKNISVQSLNWWKVGGNAEYFAAPKSVEELKNYWLWAEEHNLPIHILSGGSNVLFPDGLLKGLLLSLHELRGLEIVEHEPEVIIKSWAGTPKAEVAKVFLQKKLAPAVFITGIPGDMGAGVVMNAGIGENRTPREFCEIVREIEVLRFDKIQRTFSTVKIRGQDIAWEYRHSSGWRPGVIISVTVAWPNSPSVDVVNDVRAQTRKRITTQPLDLPNCGSVFRNPHGHKSAQLIEACGLKGYRIGGACVSLKHANFIVNDQGATAQDIHQIIKHVRETVLREKGIELHAEVVYVGDWSDLN